ncbi:MAG: hypothetical protein ACP5FZ_01500 [Fidelibacterota bacterium]
MKPKKEQLRQSLLLERQANFLKLIPGVVHNLCNPLTIIGTRAQLLQMKMPDTPDFQKIVTQSKNIESILNNLVFIVQNFQDVRLQSVDVNRLIRNETDFLTANPHFKHNIIRDIQYYPGNSSVKNSYFHIATLFHFTILFLIDRLQNSSKNNLWIICDRTNSAVTIKIRTDMPALADQKQPIEQQLADPDSETPDICLKNLSRAALMATEMNIVFTVQITSEIAEFLMTIPRNE